MATAEMNYFGTMLAPPASWQCVFPKEHIMAKYGKKAKEEVGKAIHKTKRGTQKSGKKSKAKSRKQAIAIGLSKARKKGAKVPRKKSSKKKS
jgi:hypothetical protein